MLYASAMMIPSYMQSTKAITLQNIKFLEGMVSHNI
jgi:hypothetical protein